jgi:hypothetical protein
MSKLRVDVDTARAAGKAKEQNLISFSDYQRLISGKVSKKDLKLAEKVHRSAVADLEMVRISYTSLIPDRRAKAETAEELRNAIEAQIDAQPPSMFAQIKNQITHALSRG